MHDLVVGADGRKRCGWCVSAPDYVAYHDDEWGRPVRDDDRLFEKLCLEGFQSGLSWLTILRKREGFRQAFAGFDIEAVARFGPADVERLLGDAGIVRHRGKIEAAIANAVAAARVQEEGGSLADLVWSFAPTAPTSRATTHGRSARRDTRIDGACKGASAPRVPVRRTDHRVRVHAVHGAGERPSRWMLLPDRRMTERVGRLDRWSAGSGRTLGDQVAALGLRNSDEGATARPRRLEQHRSCERFEGGREHLYECGRAPDVEPVVE